MMNQNPKSKKIELGKDKLVNDKTLIILDTNSIIEGKNNCVIHSSFCSNSSFNEIQEFIEKNKIKDKIVFGIPEIVFEEHHFQRRKKFEEDLKYLKIRIKQFKKMDILEKGTFDLKFKSNFDYKNFLLNLIKESENFILLRIPDEKRLETYEKVLNKAINHLRPFHKEGKKNFKDALIWECICCQDFRNYVWVIFLTFNPTDFPKNNDFDEINNASKCTGKIIHIVSKVEEVKQDLRQVYKLVEKEIKRYILDYFKDRIKEDVEEYLGSVLENFNLIEETIKIDELNYSDLEDSGMQEEWDNRENIRIINFEFEGDINGKHQKFFGKMFFDNNVKEILWRRYDEA